MQTTTNPYPDVPLPAGATKVYDWCDIGHRDVFREFEGASYIIDRDEEGDDDRLEVVVLGNQKASGQLEGLHIKLYGGDGAELTAPRARRLGRALLAAEAELDRWESRR
jgi:hypothetical protein